MSVHPLPWHLVDIWWDIKSPAEEFKSFSMEISLDKDMPADHFNLYVAPISGGFEDGTDFYGGLQTNIGGYPASKPEDQSGPYHKGKGGIFSRWGEHLDLSFVRSEPDGFVEAAGYEGDFVSGRRPYPWKAGSYIFEIRRLPRTKGDDKASSWLGAFVTDKATGATSRIASLKFPGHRLRFKNSFASFVEFYGGKEVDIPSLPALEIRFSRPLLNDKPVALLRISASHPHGADALAAPALIRAELSADGSQVLCRLSSRVLTDRPNDYSLYPKKSRP